MQDKRICEVHGKEYKLAPVYKINVLRMFMIGKAKAYIDVGGRQGPRRRCELIITRSC